MKTSQVLAAGAALAGFAQACTRIRVDQVRMRSKSFICITMSDDRVSITNDKQSLDQNDPDVKYTTITAYDNDKPPIGVTDHRSSIHRDADGFLFGESTGQIDVGLDYYEGLFAKKIGGSVAFPWAPGYTNGESRCMKSGCLRSLH